MAIGNRNYLPSPQNEPAKKRASRCRVIPIISILCVLISTLNIYLMVNVLLLEAKSRDDNDGNDSIWEQKNRKTREIARSSQPLEEHGLVETAEPPSKLMIASSWTSPHLMDCKAELAKPAATSATENNEDQEHGEEDDGGMLMPIHCPSSTACTKPIFLMNIHNPLKDSVSYTIYKEGCFECSHLSKMLDALSTHSNSILVDIGGNIGMWTLAAAAANHETYTIEPFSLNYRRICRSVESNDGFDSKVHVLSVAATSMETTFRIDVPRKNKGGGRVAALNEGPNTDHEFIVTGVTIDSLNLPVGDRPVVMKLDVEGHEFQALAGAINFLRRANIVYAMTELRPTFQIDDETYKKWKEILGILSEDKGLVPYRIDYEEETRLDVGRLHEWRHLKHPKVRYFDVVWRKE